MTDNLYETVNGKYTPFGNLAYDSLNPAAEVELPREKSKGISFRPKREYEKSITAKTFFRPKQHVAPTAVIGFAGAAVLIVFLLMARIQLTAVSNESAILETQIMQLKTEQTRLLIEYESAFNPSEIEEYAMEFLGMQKPGSDQVIYIDAGASDKVVIPKTETSVYNGFMSRLFNFIPGLEKLF
ncbi:MAG: cell division protein FtsL [Oscillospiraceae bacterium]|nr:cell division protein FtsL [Oscillospiraceae bacterium]